MHTYVLLQKMILLFIQDLWFCLQHKVKGSLRSESIVRTKRVCVSAECSALSRRILQNIDPEQVRKLFYFKVKAVFWSISICLIIETNISWTNIQRGLNRAQMHWFKDVAIWIRKFPSRNPLQTFCRIITIQCSSNFM